jgi:hypothetical protein
MPPIPGRRAIRLRGTVQAWGGVKWGEFWAKEERFKQSDHSSKCAQKAAKSVEISRKNSIKFVLESKNVNIKTLY